MSIFYVAFHQQHYPKLTPTKLAILGQILPVVIFIFNSQGQQTVQGPLTVNLKHNNEGGSIQI